MTRSVRFALVLILGSVVLLSSRGAEASLMPLGPNELLVHQAITPASGQPGYWQYTFDFTNSASSEIWRFVVYTAVTPNGLQGSFPFVSFGNLATVFPEYDPRSIDPDLLYYVNMHFAPWATPGYALPIGDAGSLSFVASAYDGSPKLFIYETIASGYTQSNGGFVAAYGYTEAVPEPASLLLLGTGLTASMRAVRKRRG